MTQEEPRVREIYTRAELEAFRVAVAAGLVPLDTAPDRRGYADVLGGQYAP